MRCPACRKDFEGDLPCCPYCSHKIYEIRLAPSFVYRKNNRPVSIQVQLLNNGGFQVILEAVLAGSSVVKSFVSNFGNPDYKAAHMIRAGQKVDHSIELDLPTSSKNLNLHFKAKVQGLVLDLTPDGIDLPIYDLPELKIPSIIEVDPLSDQIPALVVELANASQAQITQIELSGANGIGVDTTQLPVMLAPSNPPVKFPLIIAKNIIGKFDMTAKISLAGLEARALPLQMRVLGLPKLKTEIKKFTDTGYRFEDVSELAVLEWQVPRDSEREKIIQISTVKSENTTNELFVSPKVSAPLKFKDTLNAPITLIRRLLSVKLDNLDRDTISDLTLEIHDRQETVGKRFKRFDIHIKTFDRQKYLWPVGLDFGTTNSCLALVMPKLGINGWETDQRDNIERPLRIERVFERDEAPWIEASSLMLSAIAPPDALLFGREALAKNPLLNFKLLVKDNVALKNRKDFGDKLPDSIVKDYMKEVFQRSIYFLEERGIEPSQFQKVRLTVPTVFAPAWKRRLVHACKSALEEAAGVSDPEVKPVDESIAALQYCLEYELEFSTAQDGVIMVIDFGGGTTDITVVEKNRDKNIVVYDVVAWGGDPGFGGSNFDQLIVQTAEETQVLLATPSTVEPSLTLQSEELALMEAQAIKHLLHSGDQILGQYLKNRNYVGLKGEKIPRLVHAFRDKIEKRLKERVSKMIDGVFSELEKLPGYTNGNRRPLQVILAGNSSQVYGYEEIVHYEITSQLQKQHGALALNYIRIFHPRQPKYCVAIGAFRYGVMPIHQPAIREVCPFEVLISVGHDIGGKNIKAHGSNKYYFIGSRKADLPFPPQEINLDVLGFRNDMDVNLSIYTQSGNENPEFYKTLSFLRKNIRENTRLFIQVTEDAEIKPIWK
ncbi:MAG: Chaperone protein HscA [Syntrophorhabdaceae bacterium]|nr:Chaperone protein HscA [Syntrophorhabdaceae bacterium]